MMYWNKVLPSWRSPCLLPSSWQLCGSPYRTETRAQTSLFGPYFTSDFTWRFTLCSSTHIDVYLDHSAQRSLLGHYLTSDFTWRFTLCNSTHIDVYLDHSAQRSLLGLYLTSDFTWRFTLCSSTHIDVDSMKTTLLYGATYALESKSVPVYEFLLSSDQQLFHNIKPTSHLSKTKRILVDYDRFQLYPRTYSQLSLKRTPSGPKLLSGLERCPL